MNLMFNRVRTEQHLLQYTQKRFQLKLIYIPIHIKKQYKCFVFEWVKLKYTCIPHYLIKQKQLLLNRYNTYILFFRCFDKLFNVGTSSGFSTISSLLLSPLKKNVLNHICKTCMHVLDRGMWYIKVHIHIYCPPLPTMKQMTTEVNGTVIHII